MVTPSLPFRPSHRVNRTQFEPSINTVGENGQLLSENFSNLDLFWSNITILNFDTITSPFRCDGIELSGLRSLSTSEDSVPEFGYFAQK